MEWICGRVMSDGMELWNGDVRWSGAQFLKL
jgi:hypothetical protein